MIAVFLEKKYPNITNITWILLMFSLLESAAGGFAYYISLYLSTNTHFNGSQIGLIGSMMGIGSVAGAILGALISDKLNPQKIILFSLLASGIVFYLTPYSASIEMISCCVFVMGASSSTFMTSNSAFILKTVPQTKDDLYKAQSLRASFENTGNALSIALIMFVAGQAYKEIFHIVGIIFILISLSTIKYLAIVRSYKVNVDLSDVKTKEAYKPIGSDFFISFCCVFLIGLLFAQQRIILPLFINNQVNSLFLVGLFLFLDPLIVIFFQMRVCAKTISYNPWILMAIGSILLGGSQFALNLIHGASLLSMLCLALMIIVWVLGEMLFMPVSTVVCYDDARKDKKGLSIGGWKFAYSSGHIAGPLLAGNILHYLGYGANWFFSFCIGSIVCFICFLRYRYTTSYQAIAIHP